MTIKVSNEGIFDFLFGKKKEDETPSMKRLEKLEAEVKQLKTGPALDILQGRAKPGQELLDKLLTIAEKHLAPSQVYKQNSQLFDVLCKLVALPAPKPYSVSSYLEKAQTANEAKKVLLDYIKLMEPQVKLCRSTTKKLVTGPAKAEALFDDVTKHYADNWAFIKRYCYANATNHRTYEAATLAQDFGYPCGTMGNRDTPGVEALYEENPKQFKAWEDTLEDIADAAGEFEMLWSNGKNGKDWSNFNPSIDDVEFLVHARCALLDYVLKLKVSKEELVDGAEPVEYDADALQIGALAELEHVSAGMESLTLMQRSKQMRIGLVSAALEEMMAFEEPVEIKEGELEPTVDNEGEDLLEALEITEECYNDLCVLQTTMEAAKVDANFGKYNLPVYSRELSRIYRKLGIASTAVSTEAFSDDAVLSTEGVADTIKKVWVAFKELVAKFLNWIKGLFKSKDKGIEKTVAECKAMVAASFNANKESPAKKEPAGDEPIKVTLGGFVTNHLNSDGVYEIADFAKRTDEQFKLFAENLKTLNEATKALVEAEDVDAAQLAAKTISDLKFEVGTVVAEFKNTTDIETVAKLSTDHVLKTHGYGFASVQLNVIRGSVEDYSKKINKEADEISSNTNDNNQGRFHVLERQRTGIARALTKYAALVKLLTEIYDDARNVNGAFLRHHKKSTAA